MISTISFLFITIPCACSFVWTHSVVHRGFNLIGCFLLLIKPRILTVTSVFCSHWLDLWRAFCFLLSGRVEPCLPTTIFIIKGQGMFSSNWKLKIQGRGLRWLWGNHAFCDYVYPQGFCYWHFFTHRLPFPAEQRFVASFFNTVTVSNNPWWWYPGLLSSLSPFILETTSWGGLGGEMMTPLQWWESLQNQIYLKDSNQRFKTMPVPSICVYMK